MPTIIQSRSERGAPRRPRSVVLMTQLLIIALLISSLGFELAFRIGSFNALEPGERPDLLYLEGP